MARTTGDAAPRSVGQLFSLCVAAVRLVWRAARREFMVASSMQLASAIATAVQLVMLRALLGHVLGGHRGTPDVKGLLVTLLLFGTAMAVGNFVAAIRADQQRLLGELVMRYTQSEISEIATSIPLASFEDPLFYDRFERAKQNAQSRPTEMAAALIDLGGALVGLVTILAVVITLEPLVVPLVVIAFVPLWLASVKNSRSLHDFSYELTTSDRLRSYLFFLLNTREPAKEVRAFGINGFLRGKFDALWADRAATLRAVVRHRRRRSLMAEAATSFASVLALGTIVVLLTRGDLRLAETATVAAAIQQLGLRLRSLARNSERIYECGLFLSDYVGFVDARAHAEAAPQEELSQTGTIRLTNLSFTYPGSVRPALVDVSLTIEPGEIVALVGANGSGKTTLVKILGHLFAPDTGRISIAGRDTRDFTPESVRRSMSIIFQDFVRYEFSAAENIALQELDPSSRPQLATAAERAGAREFIEQLPEGYETILSKAYGGGTDLSLGQWQRVALARAFYRDAPVLILDEPTASLDPRAEYEFFATVRELARGRSVIFVSHRFSSVRAADRIYVLEKGRMVEHGSHEELVAHGGLYAELFNLQARAYLGSDDDRKGRVERPEAQQLQRVIDLRDDVAPDGAAASVDLAVTGRGVGSA